VISRRLLIGIALLLAAVASMPRPAHSALDAEAAGSAQALRERHQSLQAEGDNRFGRPLHVTSTESARRVSGEVHALVNTPFAESRAVLGDAGHWCQILLLHLNTKLCRAESGAQTTRLSMRIGKKSSQPPEDAFQVEFGWKVKASTQDYLQVEATSAGRNQTLLRFSYGYGFGTLGQMAMKTYLNTAGRHKVGFTVTGKQEDGSPRYVGGMRGLVERNTMRYYLAVEAWLGARNAPAASRIEKSLRDWFTASERYPRQLHEVDEREYMEMKRKEYARHQASFSIRSEAGS
jgi:hypothetical protein